MTEPLDFRKIVSLMVANDPAVVPELDKMIARLQAVRDRFAAQTENPTSSINGIGDRAQLAVVGPDGSVKQTSDTSKR